MTIKLLTGHHLDFLSLKRGCTVPSESTLVEIPHCWKSHVAAQSVNNRSINQHSKYSPKSARHDSTLQNPYSTKVAFLNY